MNIASYTAKNGGSWIGAFAQIATHVMAVYILIWLIPFLKYVLPYPHAVVVSLIERDLATGLPNLVWIAEHLGVTILDATAGFTIGNGMAVILSIVMVFLPRSRSIIMRDAIAIKSIPWIVMIPILMLVLGPSMKTRVVLVSLACFFPTLVNFFTGLHEVDQDVMDYTKTLPGITPWATLRHVRLYYSLPYLFASLKTAASVVILSSVVVEWLVAGSGLGWLLYLFNYRYRMDLLIALAIFTGLLSYSFMRGVSVVEKYVMNSVGEEKDGRI